MANKRTSASDKAHHITYKTQKIWERNRKRKLERALKRNPENKQITVALSAISYRRGTPKNPHWNATDIKMALLVKQVAGFCNKDIFHANKDLRNVAWASINSKKAKSGITSTFSTVKNLFSLKTRAHTGGVLIWA